MTDSRGLCLVIDDDRYTRELLTLILTQLGFDVQAVRNGVEGVAAAWEHHPVLVAVDLNLPDMDGLDVARHIRERCGAPILFITAPAAADDETAGMAIGTAAYLTKPFRPRQLTEVVNRLRPAAVPLAAHRQKHRA